MIGRACFCLGVLAILLSRPPALATEPVAGSHARDWAVPDVHWMRRSLSEVDTTVACDQAEVAFSVKPDGTPETPGGMQLAGRSATVFQWQAAGSVHRPLYFEELGPERYGRSCHCGLQPVLSAVHFFGSAVILPVRMLAEPPCQCQTTFRPYRPGSRLPCGTRPLCCPATAWTGK